MANVAISPFFALKFRHFSFLRMFKLVLRGAEPFRVQKDALRQLGLFKEHPELLEVGQYNVQSKVSAELFEEFINNVMCGNDDIIMTIENASQLQSLYKEFRHPGLAELRNQIKSIQATANLMSFGNQDIRIEELEIAMEETKGILAQGSIERDELRDALQEATRQLNTALAEVKSHNNAEQIRNLTNSIDDLKKQNKQLEARLAQLTGEGKEGGAPRRFRGMQKVSPPEQNEGCPSNQKLLQMLQRLEASIDGIQAKNTQIEDKITHLTNDIQNLTVKYEDLSAQVRAQGDQKRGKVTEELQQELKRLKSNIDGIQRKNTQLENNQSRMANDFQTLTREYKDFSTTIRVKVDKTENVGDVIEAIQRELRNLDESHGALIDRNSRLEKTISDNSSTLLQIKETVKALDKKLAGHIVVKSPYDKSERGVGRESPSKSREGRPFPYSGNPLDGIIAYFTRMNGNVHTARIVTVTASSTDWDMCQPEYVADLQTTDSFVSEDEEESWISYNFRDRVVIVSGYSIKSNDESRWHPRSWIVEGSNDEFSWTEIDSRERANTINRDNKGYYFTVREESSSFRVVRFRQTGPNSSGTDRLCISGFELFGTVLDSPNPSPKLPSLYC